MKRKNMILFCASILLSIGVFASINTYASSTAEQEARYAIDEYFQAVQAGDVENMMKYTKDLRFPNEAEKRQIYEMLAKDNDEVRDLEILSFETLDKSKMLLSISFTSKYSGPHHLEMPVIKENGQWKVVVGEKRHHSVSNTLEN